MERAEEVTCGEVAQDPRVLGNFGATVSGLQSDPEEGVIGKDQWHAIHERRKAGVSVSALAREFDLDRKTVRACLRQSEWMPYRRQARGATVLDAHRAWLAERAPQVNYSARILHQELRGQRGFAGSYETVKLAVRPLRRRPPGRPDAAPLRNRTGRTGPG